MKISLLFQLALLLILPILIWGCNPGQLWVQHSDKPLREVPTKVVSIDPDLLWLGRRESPEGQVLVSETRQAQFVERLEYAAAKAGIDLNVLTPTNLQGDDLSYFNDLLPLRRHIIQVNGLQEEGRSTSDGEVFDRRIEEEVLRTPMQLSSEYAYLAEKYDTPYFSIQGLVSLKTRRKEALGFIFLFPPLAAAYFVPKYHLAYYQIVVDVVSSEVVFRELREVRSTPTNMTLDVMIYDSFSLFKALI